MRSKLLGPVSMTAAILLATPSVYAIKLETDNPDLKMRWDNTLKYSTIYRLEDPDQAQLDRYISAPENIGSPAGDGDYNFKKGIASSRLDWLTEFDLVHQRNKGFRISGSGWLDSVYKGNNDNKTPYTHNLSVPADEFTSDTEEAVGEDFRLMDAFTFYKGDLGDMPASVRIGRHTVIYGETLMSGSNGIAAAQGPVDIVKAATVPGAQVKEFLLPTNQISVTLRPASGVSLGAYYQFEWEESDFFPAGSFLSPNDVVGPGGESFLNTPQGASPRTADLTPKDDGQWGAQLRYRPESVDVELGFYAANYHDKLPSAIYVNLVNVPFDVNKDGVVDGRDAVPGGYTRAYQENIRTFGFSASTVLGDDNVSIEISKRENAPITGGVCSGDVSCGYFIADASAIAPIPGFDKDNIGYAVGKTTHMTLVDIHLFQPGGLLPDGGSLATQFDYHQVDSVTKNKDMIDPTTSKSASTITLAFTADFYQVADGWDLSVPVVLSRNLSGRSRANIGWVEDGGSLDLGLNFTYQNAWKGGFNYHHFLGNEGTGAGSGHFDQGLYDRDYISFNVSRAF
jgi:hypothetical protein